MSNDRIDYHLHYCTIFYFMSFPHLLSLGCKYTMFLLHACTTKKESEESFQQVKCNHPLDVIKAILFFFFFFFCDFYLKI